MSDMDERTDRVIKISKPPSSLKAWLGDGSSEPRAIDSLTAYNWVYALITDREALVRFARTDIEFHDMLDGSPDLDEVHRVRDKRYEAYKALSQELRDAIEGDDGDKA